MRRRSARNRSRAEGRRRCRQQRPGVRLGRPLQAGGVGGFLGRQRLAVRAHAARDRPLVHLVAGDHADAFAREAAPD